MWTYCKPTLLMQTRDQLETEQKQSPAEQLLYTSSLYPLQREDKCISHFISDYLVSSPIHAIRIITIHKKELVLSYLCGSRHEPIQ